MRRQEPSVNPSDRPSPRLIRPSGTPYTPELRAGERMVIPSVAPEDEDGPRPRLLRTGVIVLVTALALLGGAGLVRAFVGL